MIWIRCETSDDKLHRLKNALDTTLIPFGFEVEQRQFHPHITLGRVKSSRRLNHLTPVLEKLTFEPRMGTVHEVLVMKSLLRPQGAEYTVLKSIHLRSS